MAMWVNAFIFMGTATFLFAAETCKPKSCLGKPNSQEKPVCGSDGITYPNRCVFGNARCQNQNLTLIKRGPCKHQKTCREQTKFLAETHHYDLNLECRLDGSYGSSQCYPHSGFCWCVAPNGTPVPFTSVKYRDATTKALCGKKKSKRRSPVKKNRNVPCKSSDKSLFNSHLIGLFQTEWQRFHSTQFPGNDTVVLNWKFDHLDASRDGKLQRIEYRDLRRMIKKFVKPKRCAKNFFKSCDLNSDQDIERQEWTDCLARNSMDDGRGSNTSDDSEDQEDLEEQAPSSRSPPHGVLSQDGGSLPNYDDDSSEIKDEEPANCLSDRETALAESTQAQSYIPKCTSDGRYQKIQCYESTGYCWCVNEDTGKNIPGTSVKNETPKCDILQPSMRPMKGCPEKKKLVFLKDLMEFLQKKINTSSAYNDLTWKGPNEEQIAKLSFVMFDTNKNKILDRNERKYFKEMMINVKKLSKCGKKLPRYCDINKDRQISMTEWLLCLNVQNASVSSFNIVNQVKNVTSSRAGKKNPLNMLKAD